MTKRYATGSRRRRGERGQVLILAVVALILVIIAILLLFDVQTVIRGKVKAQNGVDAAALTGAEWQKHSLNLIGELNLVRATGTLISDPFFARGILDAPSETGNAAEVFAEAAASACAESCACKSSFSCWRAASAFWTAPRGQEPTAPGQE